VRPGSGPSDLARVSISPARYSSARRQHSPRALRGAVARRWCGRTSRTMIPETGAGGILAVRRILRDRGPRAAVPGSATGSVPDSDDAHPGDTRTSRGKRTVMSDSDTGVTVASSGMAGATSNDMGRSEGGMPRLSAITLRSARRHHPAPPTRARRGGAPRDVNDQAGGDRRRPRSRRPAFPGRGPPPPGSSPATVPASPPPPSTAPRPGPASPLRRSQRDVRERTASPNDSC
jgi:hypothetical protein